MADVRNKADEISNKVEGRPSAEYTGVAREIDDELKSTFSTYEERMAQARALTEELVRRGSLPELLLDNFDIYDADGNGVIEKSELEEYIYNQSLMNEAERSPFSLALAEAFLKRFDSIETADNAQYDMRPGETDGRAGRGAIEEWSRTHLTCERLENGTAIFKDSDGRVTGFEYPDGRHATFVYDENGLVGWTDINGNQFVRRSDGTWKIYDEDGSELYGPNGERTFSDVSITGPSDDGSFRWSDGSGQLIEYHSRPWGAQITELNYSIEYNTYTQVLENGSSLSVKVDEDGRVMSFETPDGFIFWRDPFDDSRWERFPASDYSHREQVSPSEVSFDPETGEFRYVQPGVYDFAVTLQGELPVFSEATFTDNGTQTDVSLSLPDGATVEQENGHWYLLNGARRIELVGVSYDGTNLTIDGLPFLHDDGSYTIRTTAGTTESFNPDGQLSEVTTPYHQVDYASGRVVRITSLVDSSYWAWDDADRGWFQYTAQGERLESYGPADLQNFDEDAFLTRGGFTFVYRDSGQTETLRLDGSAEVLDASGTILTTRNDILEYEYPNGVTYSMRGSEQWIRLDSGDCWHLVGGQWQYENARGDVIDSGGAPLLIANRTEAGALELTYMNGVRVSIVEVERRYPDDTGVMRTTTLSGGVTLSDNGDGDIFQYIVPVSGGGQEATLATRIDNRWLISARGSDGSLRPVAAYEGEMRTDALGPFIALEDGRKVRFSADGTFSVESPDFSRVRFDRNGHAMEAYGPDGRMTERFYWAGNELIGIEPVVPLDPVLQAEAPVWSQDENGVWTEYRDGESTGRFYRLGENGSPELQTEARRSDGSRIVLNSEIPPQIERLICANGTQIDYRYDADGTLVEARISATGQESSYTVVLEPSRAGQTEATPQGEVLYTGQLSVDLQGNLTYEVGRQTDDYSDDITINSRSILSSGWELQLRNGSVIGTRYVDGDTVIDRHLEFYASGDVQYFVENGIRYDAHGQEGSFTYQRDAGGGVYEDVIVNFDGAGTMYRSTDGVTWEVSSPAGWSFTKDSVFGDLSRVDYACENAIDLHPDEHSAGFIMRRSEQTTITVKVDGEEVERPAWIFTPSEGQPQIYVLGDDNQWYSTITDGPDRFISSQVAYRAISGTPDGRIMLLLEDESVQIINLDGTRSLVQSSLGVGMREEALRERAELLHSALVRFNTDEEAALIALSGMTLADRLLLIQIYEEMYGQGERGINRLLTDILDRTHGEVEALMIAELYRSDDTRPNDRAQIERALALVEFDQRGGETALRSIFAVLTRAEIEQLVADYPGLLLLIRNNPHISETTKAAVDVYLRGRDNNFDNGYMRDDVALELGELALTAGDYRMFCEAVRNASPSARAIFQADHPELQTENVFGDDKQPYVLDWLDTGQISLESLIRDNINFGWHNKDAISADMLNAPPEQRDMFILGYQIRHSGREPVTQDEIEAVAYYERVHEALVDAGVTVLERVESDVVKWEALLMYGDCLLTQIITLDNHNAARVMPLIENMSPIEISRLVQDPFYRDLFFEGFAALYGTNSYEYLAASRIIDGKVAAYNEAVLANNNRAVFSNGLAALDQTFGWNLSEFVGGVIPLETMDPMVYANREGRRVFVDQVIDSGRHTEDLVDGIFNLSFEELQMLRNNTPIPEFFSAHNQEGTSEGYYDYLCRQIRERCGWNADLLIHMIDIIRQNCPPMASLEALEPFGPVYSDLLSGADPATFVHDLQEVLKDPNSRALLEADPVLKSLLEQYIAYTCQGVFFRLDHSTQMSFQPEEADFLATENDSGWEYQPWLNCFTREITEQLLAGRPLSLEQMLWFDDASSNSRERRFSNIVDYVRIDDVATSDALRERQLEVQRERAAYILASREVLFQGLSDEQIEFLEQLLENGSRFTDAQIVRFYILDGGAGANGIYEYLADLPMERRLSMMAEYAELYGKDFRSDLYDAVGDDQATRIDYSFLIDPVHITEPREYVYLSLFRYLDANSGWAAGLLRDGTSEGADMGFNELAAAAALGELSDAEIRQVFDRAEALIQQYVDSQVAFTQNVEMVLSTVGGLLMSLGCPPLAVGRLAMAFVAGAAFRVGMMNAFLGRLYDDQNIGEDAFIGGLNFMLNYIGPQHFGRALSALGFGDEVARGALAGLNLADDAAREAAEATVSRIAMQSTTGNGGRIAPWMLDELMTLPAFRGMEREAVQALVEAQIRTHFVGLGRQILEKGVILAVGSGAGGLTAGADVALFHLDPDLPFFEQVLPAVGEGMKAGAVGALIFTGAFQVGGTAFARAGQWMELRLNGNDMTARFQEDAVLVMRDGRRVNVSRGDEVNMRDVEFVERPGTRARIPMRTVPIYEAVAVQGEGVDGPSNVFEVRINNETIRVVRGDDGQFRYEGGAKDGQIVDVVLRVGDETWIPASIIEALNATATPAESSNVEPPNENDMLDNQRARNQTESLRREFAEYTPLQLEQMRTEITAEWLSVVRTSDGMTVQQHLDSMLVDGRLSQEQYIRILNVLAEVKEHFARTGANNNDSEQLINWLHTVGELGRVLQIAEARGLRGTALEDCLYASMFSDSVKSSGPRGNFTTHHIDGALAADVVLSRYFPGADGEARIRNIQQAILEHQISPPGFMGRVHANIIRGILRSQGRLDAEAEVLVASIERKFASMRYDPETGNIIAEPMRTTADGRSVIDFTPEEAALLRMIGVTDVYLRSTSNPWDVMSQVLLEADVENYSSPQGIAKILALHAVRGPFGDPYIYDAFMSPTGASAMDSFNDSMALLSPEAQGRVRAVMADTNHVMRQWRDYINDWILRQPEFAAMASGRIDWPDGNPMTAQEINDLANLTAQEFVAKYNQEYFQTNYGRDYSVDVEQAALLRDQLYEIEVPYWNSALTRLTPDEEGRLFEYRRRLQEDPDLVLSEADAADFNALSLRERQTDFAQRILDESVNHLRGQQREDGVFVDNFRPSIDTSADITPAVARIDNGFITMERGGQMYRIRLDVVGSVDQALVDQVTLSLSQLPNSTLSRLQNSGIRIFVTDDVAMNYASTIAGLPVPGQPGKTFGDVSAFFDSNLRGEVINGEVGPPTFVVRAGGSESQIFEEVGHALDFLFRDTNGTPFSRSSDFGGAHRFDVDHLPVEVRNALPYYAALGDANSQAEAFAMAYRILVKRQQRIPLDDTERLFATWFPTTMRYAEAKLVAEGLLLQQSTTMPRLRLDYGAPPLDASAYDAFATGRPLAFYDAPELTVTSVDGSAVTVRYDVSTQKILGTDAALPRGEYTVPIRDSRGNVTGEVTLTLDTNGNVVSMVAPDGTTFSRNSPYYPWRTYGPDGAELSGQQFRAAVDFTSDGQPVFRFDHARSTEYRDMSGQTYRISDLEGVAYYRDSETGLWYQEGLPTPLDGEVVVQVDGPALRRQGQAGFLTYGFDGTLLEVETSRGVFHRASEREPWYLIDDRGVTQLNSRINIGLTADQQPRITFLDQSGNLEISDVDGNPLRIITNDGVVFDRVDSTAPWVRTDGEGAARQVAGDVKLTNQGRVVIETVDPATNFVTQTGVDGRIVVFNAENRIVQIGSGDQALHFTYSDGALFEIMNSAGELIISRSALPGQRNSWLQWDNLTVDGEDILSYSNISSISTIMPQADGGIIIVGADGSRQIIYPGEQTIFSIPGDMSGPSGAQVRDIFGLAEPVAGPDSSIRITTTENAPADVIAIANQVYDVPANQRAILERDGVKVLVVDDVYAYRPDLASQMIPGQDVTFAEARAFYDPDTRTIVLMRGATLDDLSEEVWHAINHSMRNFAGSPVSRQMYTLDTLNPALTPERLRYFGIQNAAAGDAEAFQMAARILMKLDQGMTRDQLSQIERDFLDFFPATMEITAQRLHMEGLMEHGPWELDTLRLHSRATAEDPYPDIPGWEHLDDGTIKPPENAYGSDDLVAVAARAEDPKVATLREQIRLIANTWNGDMNTLVQEVYRYLGPPNNPNLRSTFPYDYARVITEVINLRRDPNLSAEVKIQMIHGQMHPVVLVRDHGREVIYDAARYLLNRNRGDNRPIVMPIDRWRQQRGFGELGDPPRDAWTPLIEARPAALRDSNLQVQQRAFAEQIYQDVARYVSDNNLTGNPVVINEDPLAIYDWSYTDDALGRTFGREEWYRWRLQNDFEFMEPRVRELNRLIENAIANSDNGRVDVYIALGSGRTFEYMLTPYLNDPRVNIVYIRPHFSQALGRGRDPFVLGHPNPDSAAIFFDIDVSTGGSVLEAQRTLTGLGYDSSDLYVYAQMGVAGGRGYIAGTAEDALLSRDIRNYATVSDGVFRGSQPSRQGFDRLRDRGVRTVIDLRNDSVGWESSYVLGLGMDYINIAINPYTATPEQLNAAVEQFLRIMNDPRNQPVFIHCEHGSDRTGMMLAIYRIQQGWSFEQAYQEMRFMGFNVNFENLRRQVENYYATRSGQ